MFLLCFSFAPLYGPFSERIGQNLFSFYSSAPQSPKLWRVCGKLAVNTDTCDKPNTKRNGYGWMVR
ncbi:MAG: hypothetical protein K0R48_1451 [Gammaproteobacteria bacterium]|jgi:hypothetical protein|nr:hypothetical protein [Gammaproteobacteria bacterium]